MINELKKLIDELNGEILITYPYNLPSPLKAVWGIEVCIPNKNDQAFYADTLDALIEYTYLELIKTNPTEKTLK